MNRETARAIIFDFRVKNGLTLREVSEGSGVSRATLIGIEKGRITPHAVTLGKIKSFMENNSETV